MAINVNKAILVGRLGADPERKGTMGDMVTCSVATSEKWKDKDGTPQERTQWHKVVVFAQQPGDYLAQYGRKGDLVAIEGQIETRKWERGPNEVVYITEIVVKPYNGSVQILSEKPEPREEQPKPQEQPKPRRSSLEDDEIPF